MRYFPSLVLLLILLVMGFLAAACPIINNLEPWHTTTATPYGYLSPSPVGTRSPWITPLPMVSATAIPMPEQGGQLLSEEILAESKESKAASEAEILTVDKVVSVWEASEDDNSSGIWYSAWEYSFNEETERCELKESEEFDYNHFSSLFNVFQTAPSLNITFDIIKDSPEIQAGEYISYVLVNAAIKDLNKEEGDIFNLCLDWQDLGDDFNGGSHWEAHNSSLAIYTVYLTEPQNEYGENVSVYSNHPYSVIDENAIRAEVIPKEDGYHLVMVIGVPYISLAQTIGFDVIYTDAKRSKITWNANTEHAWVFPSLLGGLTLE